MGFWSRSNSAPAAPPAPPGGDTPPVPADAPPAPSTPSAVPPPTPGSLDARNAAADAEFAALLSELQSETSQHHDHPPTSSPFSPSAPHVPAGTPPTPAQKPTGIPERMSCLTAFDEMYYCYSLGGQFLNVYRYGNLRDCSEKSKDWRFCMKTRMYPEEERRKMVREHYREKERRVRQGRSSEDVWEMRSEDELFKEPFSGKVEDLRADRLD